MKPNYIILWIGSCVTCRAARQSSDVCKAMREKLNSAFQIAGSGKMGPCVHQEDPQMSNQCFMCQ